MARVSVTAAAASNVHAPRVAQTAVPMRAAAASVSWPLTLRVPQSHARLGMPQQARDHGQRSARHDRVAREGLAKIVEPHSGMPASLRTLRHSESSAERQVEGSFADGSTYAPIRGWRARMACASALRNTAR